MVQSAFHSKINLLFSFLIHQNQIGEIWGGIWPCKKSTEAKCRYTDQTIKSNPGLDGIVAFEGVQPTDMSKDI